MLSIGRKRGAKDRGRSVTLAGFGTNLLRGTYLVREEEKEEGGDAAGAAEADDDEAACDGGGLGSNFVRTGLDAFEEDGFEEDGFEEDGFEELELEFGGIVDAGGVRDEHVEIDFTVGGGVDE